jgi:hypothetical protein
VWRDGVAAGRHVPIVWKVPRRWDQDLVVGEDLRLLRVQVRRPRVSAADAAAASLVVVRHWDLGRGCVVRVGDGPGRGVCRPGVRIEARARRGRHGDTTCVSAWPAGSAMPREPTCIHGDG